MLEQVVAGTIPGERGGQFDFSPVCWDVHTALPDQEPRADHRFNAERSGEEGSAPREAETGTVILLCDAGSCRQFSNSSTPSLSLRT